MTVVTDDECLKPVAEPLSRFPGRGEALRLLHQDGGPGLRSQLAAARGSGDEAYEQDQQETHGGENNECDFDPANAPVHTSRYQQNQPCDPT